MVSDVSPVRVATDSTSPSDSNQTRSPEKSDPDFDTNDEHASGPAHVVATEAENDTSAGASGDAQPASTRADTAASTASATRLSDVIKLIAGSRRVAGAQNARLTPGDEVRMQTPVDQCRLYRGEEHSPRAETAPGIVD